MIESKYIGVIDGFETWEVYLDGALIGTNQSWPSNEQQSTSQEEGINE